MITTTPNRLAFLTMIAVSEGTKGHGDDGYNVLFGGGLFNGYADHPRHSITCILHGRPITSTAAGRYQLLARYFDAYKTLLKLPDFSPPSQDQIALQQIRERKALDDIDAGRLDVAIGKCRNIWASFPGAGYNQPEHSLITLREAFLEAGGTVA